VPDKGRHVARTDAVFYGGVHDVCEVGDCE
jgi:hypothetical protein